MSTTKAAQIKALLANTSVTFAGIHYTTKVATAAKHKTIEILKHTNANVQLFNNINEFTNVYENAVNRNLAKAGNTEEFTAQTNYFEHTDCYSIVQHKSKDAYYLYAIFNNAHSEYFIDGMNATKEEVAMYLTPSAATQLLNPVKPEHNVIVRTIGLDNIESITANKQTVYF
jgi:hypothetical protein